jgi:inositol polyphosphate-4-phosphatase
MRFNKSEVTGLAAQPSHKFEKEGVLFIREKQEGFFRKTESKTYVFYLNVFPISFSTVFCDHCLIAFDFLVCKMFTSVLGGPLCVWRDREEQKFRFVDFDGIIILDLMNF